MANVRGQETVKRRSRSTSRSTSHETSTERTETRTREVVDTTPQIKKEDLPQLKDPSLWSRMGGPFRAGVIGALAAGGITWAAQGVATAVAASAAPLATAKIVTSVALTLGLGGAGMLAVGAAALVATGAAITRAVNKNYKNTLNQKALAKKLVRELKRKRNRSLSDKQQEMLKKALENPKLAKYFKKLAKRNPEIAKQLKFASENGFTNMVFEPTRGNFITRFFSRITTRTSTKSNTTEQTHEEEEEHTRTIGGNDHIYRTISSKTLFDANLSAREWIALQQIYNRQMKATTAQIAALRRKEPVDEAKIEELQTLHERLAKMERRAHDNARTRAAAESADTRNSISKEEREMLAEYARVGRKSTLAANAIKDGDEQLAERGLTKYIDWAEQQPKKETKKKPSGSR